MHIRSLAYLTCSAMSVIECASQARRESTTAAAAPRLFVSDRITVTTRADGPDIILVPGLAGHRDVWAAAAESLDDRYRLHLVQVAGFAGAAPGANANGPVAAPVAEEIARYIRESRIARSS